MPSSNAWVELLGWMLIHSVWLISVIVGVSAVGLGLLRQRSANARYLFGCVALLLSLSTLPAVLVWGLTRSVTPEEFGTLISTRSLTVIGGEAVDLDGTGETIGIDVGPELQGEPVQLEVRTWRNHDGRLLMEVDSPRPAEAHATTPMELTAWQQAESRLRPHLALLVSGWLAGVVLLSVRPLIGWHSARRLQRVGLSEVSDSLKEMLSRLAGRLGLRRAVRLFQSSLVQIPCVVGALKPVILLPASAIVGLSPEQLEALLAHELAHIRRHDFAMNVVQTLVETLLFYHPAIWWLSRQVRQEREHCCDDLAISVCGDVAGYARMLVTVEGLRGRVPQTSVAASGGSLVERIRRLLPSPHEQPRSPWLAGIIVLGSLVVLVGSWQWTVGQVSDLPEQTEPEVGRALLPVESPTEETGKSARPTNNDWPQWGRSSHRNNVADGRLPLEWDLAKGTNIVWKAKLGTSTYSSPIVSGGKVFIGTNNQAVINRADPKYKDLSCLNCFDQATGRLLWQYASEKLPAARVYDWPDIGLCSTACVDGERVWVVTNRCEVICLDANGFRDGENDGPFREEPAQTEVDADVVWKFDMFGELGVRPLYQSVSSITQVDGVLLLNTSNGPDESHVKIPAPNAPNFLALDAKTGRVIWKDNSAGESIVVGGSSCSCSGASPSVATLGGVTQAIFTGKEGWVYGYDFADLKLGKTTLLWQFDCNPKTAKYSLGNKSRRNTLLASPVVADGLVYVATGQNPEHGEGDADLWCIDPTKRGDLSTELVFNKSFENGEKPIPHKPLCACETDKGDFVRLNPNAGAIWHFAASDYDGDGKIEFEETFPRTLGNPVIHDGLLLIADLSGVLHCLDSKTGKVQWNHDLLAAVYSSCVIADGHVLVADEDGDVEIFKAARTKQPVHGEELRNFESAIYSTPVVVDGTLFVATKERLVAIRDPKQTTELKAGAAPPTITAEVFKPLECELVDAVTGKPIAENTRNVDVVVGRVGTTKPHSVTFTTRPHSQTLVVLGSFHFIKPKFGDVPEKRVTLRFYVSKSSSRITLLIPDDIMRRADRDELLLEWQLGNAPVYENYEPIERIPLKRLLSNDPKTGRDSFRTIKLTPKKKAEVPPTAPTAASWTSFRHDLAQTGVATSTLPDKLELLWETSLGGQVVGTAAIVGDHVYVPCLSGELVCLDRRTGRKLWGYRSVSEVKLNSFAPDFQPSPTVTATAIYLGDEKVKLKTFTSGFQSSPTITATAIYLGDEDGMFHAIDRATGKPRWTFKTDGEIFSSAAVVGGKVLFGSYDSHLYCLNEQDGTLAWKFATQGKVHCAPAVIDGLVLIAGCDEHLRAIDIATGTQKGDFPLGSYLIASPAVVGDLTFVGTYGNEVLAVNRKTGDVLWRYSPGKGEFPFHSSAAVTEKLVVLGGRDKLVHGIDRATGKPLWTFATSGKVDGSPVVVGQRVFIGSDDGNLYELDAATGEQRAKFHLGKPISASPAIGEGVLVIGSQSNDGKVVCFGGATTSGQDQLDDAKKADVRVLLSVPEGAHATTSPLHVIIENISDKPQSHFEEWNSWGYGNVTVEWTDAGGKVGTVAKVPGIFTKNYPSTVTLQPGEALVRKISFAPQVWQGWPEIPKGTKLRLKVIYQTAPDPKVSSWTGKVSSKEQTVLFR
ncbi:MAG: PQQ-binding-like beta-propeller repeat protein [Planctomycetaceae bacterium]|nr:PQQ-binding-like beta-propeller repeat protein [Planctomycetaceae bacterium]